MYQVRSSCYLTKISSEIRIWLLTKMNGRLYSLAPNLLVVKREKSQHRDFLQLRLLKHRFQK